MSIWVPWWHPNLGFYLEQCLGFMVQSLSGFVMSMAYGATKSHTNAQGLGQTSGHVGVQGLCCHWGHGVIWAVSGSMVCVDINGSWYHQRQYGCQKAGPPAMAMLESVGHITSGVWSVCVPCKVTRDWAQVAAMGHICSVTQQQPACGLISMAGVATAGHRDHATWNPRTVLCQPCPSLALG